MAVNPLDVRLARLEGSYEQIDRRLGSIEDRLGPLETRIDRLDTKIDSVAIDLRRDIGEVRGRVHTLLCGVIVAILVPILLRVFFP